MLGVGAARRRAARRRAPRDLAKFDDTKRTQLQGIVTLVDWRNPHVHVFMNVARADGSVENWAVELESTVLLKRSGWKHDTLQPGDAHHRAGPDGARRQPPGLGRDRHRDGDEPAGLQRHAIRDRRRRCRRARRRAAPTASRGSARPTSCGGYWAYPVSTALMQDGVNVQMNADGLLRTSPTRRASRRCSRGRWRCTSIASSGFSPTTRCS